MSATQKSNNQEDTPMDFLTPEQRLDAIADILSTIALRILREQNEQDQIL